MLGQRDKNLIGKMVNTEKKFLKVKCHECGNEQVIFSRPATQVNCVKCGALLAVSTGGKAAVKAEILELV